MPNEHWPLGQVWQMRPPAPHAEPANPGWHSPKASQQPEQFVVSHFFWATGPHALKSAVTKPSNRK